VLGDAPGTEQHIVGNAFYRLIAVRWPAVMPLGGLMLTLAFVAAFGRGLASSSGNDGGIVRP
jgi:hypothetical protein